MEKSVLCVVSSREQAVSVIAALQAAGVANAEISAIFPAKDDRSEFLKEIDIPPESVEGVGFGVGAGSFIGGTLGLLAGVGALAIPGVGPLLGLGPILALISGAMTGATFGGIAGVLVTAGVPESRAKHYEGKLRDGQILLSVHSESKESLAKASKIFNDAGAEDISTPPSSRRVPDPK
jgi:hypothetical protein